MNRSDSGATLTSDSDATPPWPADVDPSDLSLDPADSELEHDPTLGEPDGARNGGHSPIHACERCGAAEPELIDFGEGFICVFCHEATKYVQVCSLCGLLDDAMLAADGFICEACFDKGMREQEAREDAIDMAIAQGAWPWGDDDEAEADADAGGGAAPAADAGADEGHDEAAEADAGGGAEPAADDAEPSDEPASKRARQ